MPCPWKAWVFLYFTLYLAVLTASISREFLGGRCAWVKDQPGMFSLYWAGAQKCNNSFSLFISKRSIIWKGMNTNQPLLHLNKVVRHSIPLIFFFFLFILNKLLEAFQYSGAVFSLWLVLQLQLSDDFPAQRRSIQLTGCTLELSLHLHHTHLSPSPPWGTGLEAWTSGHSETIWRWLWKWLFGICF